ncbi:hypothetical protein [Litchfieldia alkalitelluris]|uniref:hypothetical protein n=1 Tax=Litchfieldia alkalitelluris TaxID=304268 RepID=UPI000996D4CD|nr:hypothetical protein [Litchfieldia alkalitelluris]
MSLKNQQLINIALVLLSWLTLPLLGKRNIKRFFPASILVVILEFFSVLIGRKQKWWVFYKKPNSMISGELPFIVGPFIVGSMWILKFTYGNFKKFIALNAVIDLIFAYPTVKILEKNKVSTLVRLNHVQFFLYIFYKAFFLYGFQYIFDKTRNTSQ